MRTVLFVFLTFCSVLSFAQSENILSNAISKDNAKALSSFFDESIDLELPDTKGIYSKQQAKLVLSEFFNKNSIISFKEKHIGGGGEKAHFHIGSIETSKQKFRTYILYHLVQDKPQIIELRIESED